MRKQYHFWAGKDGLDAWDVDRLISRVLTSLSGRSRLTLFMTSTRCTGSTGLWS